MIKFTLQRTVLRSSAKQSAIASSPEEGILSSVLSLLKVSGHPSLFPVQCSQTLEMKSVLLILAYPRFYCIICHGSHFKGDLKNMSKPKIEIIIQRLVHIQGGQKLFKSIN